MNIFSFRCKDIPLNPRLNDLDVDLAIQKWENDVAELEKSLAAPGLEEEEQKSK